MPQLAGGVHTPQVLRAHILPLTNCAFNKSGDRFITGSYDRTCKVRRMHMHAGICTCVRIGPAPGPHGGEPHAPVHMHMHGMPSIP